MAAYGIPEADIARVLGVSKPTLRKHCGIELDTGGADEPERVRGPQHDAAWCDEVASWRYPEAWDMLMFGLRLGPDPRVVVTTTPKPIKIIRELIADPTTVITRGSYASTRAPGSAGKSSTPR